MVDMALDLPQCPFSKPLTLKRLQIKEKKFPLFEVFLTWKNHVFGEFWSSKFKMINFNLSHTKMQITMKCSMFWKSIFKTYILLCLNIGNHKIHIHKTISKKSKFFIKFFNFFWKKIPSKFQKKVKLSTSKERTEVAKASKNMNENLFWKFKHFSFKRTYFQLSTIPRKKVSTIFVKIRHCATL